MTGPSKAEAAPDRKTRLVPDGRAVGIRENSVSFATLVISAAARPCRFAAPSCTTG